METSKVTPITNYFMLAAVLWLTAMTAAYGQKAADDMYPGRGAALTLVELNCENLFDWHHDIDSLTMGDTTTVRTEKEDGEWLPEATRHWTPARYWRKVNSLAQEILSCCDDGLPDLVALVEVENDSALIALTRRSLLRKAGYEYLMTQSPDIRGIDVALLYQPFTFRPICYDMIGIVPRKGMRPTRDILYVMGETTGGDTLHVFVVHAPSRFGGERATRANRRLVAEKLIETVSRLPRDAKVIVCGDFNDYATSPALVMLEEHGLRNVSREARGSNGAQGTYRYQGRWESIDHILVSPALLPLVESVSINDAPFLLEEDKKYGGVRPLRTFNGYRYQRGFSDHLPLVIRMRGGRH